MKITLSALLIVSLLTVPYIAPTTAAARTGLSEPTTIHRRPAIDRVSDILLVLAKDKDKDKDNDKDKDKDKERGKADDDKNSGPEKGKSDRGDKGKEKAKSQSPQPIAVAKGGPPADGRTDKAPEVPEKPKGKPAEKTTDPKPRGNAKDKDKDKDSKGDKDKESKGAKTGDRPMPATDPAPQPRPAPIPTPTSEPSSSQAPKSKPQAKPSDVAADMKDKGSKGRDAKPDVPKPESRPDTTVETPAPQSQKRQPMKQTEERGEPTEAEPKTPGRGRMIPEKPVAEASIDTKKATRPNVAPPSKEVERVLKDQGQRDRKMDAARANQIGNQNDAANLIQSILGQAGSGHESQGRPHSDDPNSRRRDHHERLPVDQVGRSQGERERTVDFLIRRFAGNASLNDAPPEFHSRRDNRDFDGRSPLSGGSAGRDEHGHNGPGDQHFHGPSHNRRVVCYPSRNEIPPVLLASVFLNRIQAQPLQQSAYRPGVEGGNADFYQNIPENYRSEEAYAVSYPVDPDSAVSRDDIIFQQGSTALADSYSYDLVVDLAEAMKAPALQSEKFVIEGHASAEGDYAANLQLSQERSERIARDLVDMGVDPDRLLPVGYGEAEAQYPANGAERQRSLDRKVVVFRMTEPTQ